MSRLSIMVVSGKYIYIFQLRHMASTLTFADIPAGLSSAEADTLRKQYGSNTLHKLRGQGLGHVIWDVVKEPMFILLMVATLLYFILGEQSQGLLMLAAMAFVAAISVFQELRSSHALEALRKLTAPMSSVWRDGSFRELPVEHIVPGDIVRIGEGERVPADGVIVRCNDLSVDESLLTGESIPVEKYAGSGENILYQGSTINAGMAYVKITATGDRTLLGRLGRSIGSVSTDRSELQRWIAGFVRAMAIFGIAAFLLVWLINYFHTDSITLSLLTGLTLAMSAIPEEVPVAYSSFMALGALRLTALGIVVRHPGVIEQLGRVSVLCLDKTGTLTENRMQVRNVYTADGGLEELGEGGRWKTTRVLWYGRLACEQEPFDVMEQAIIQAFDCSDDHPDYGAMHMVYEYPLEGRPPMMTHVYRGTGSLVVAGKGAPERILRNCRLEEGDRRQWLDKVQDLAANGYRVLGICSAEWHDGEYPKEQNGFGWRFEGLISLFDAPKPGLRNFFHDWQQAGVRVKIISGDYAGTVLNIAREAGIDGEPGVLTGEEVMSMGTAQLSEKVKETDVYARMFPDAKMKVIDALRANGETVAMSGDGVNDGPALRRAHVGIAMGKKGTEIARQAADLVLSDDNLGRITEAIRQGRSIRANLAKAIRYLITIHIPIILTASVPLLLGWTYPTIFAPIHIIFLELIMGPTCSIYYEREAVGKNVMTPAGRPKGGLLEKKELLITIVRGAAAAAGLLYLYYFFTVHEYTLSYTRTIVFVTLLADNVLLTVMGGRRNPLMGIFLLSSAVFIGLIYFMPLARQPFGLTTVAAPHLLMAAAVSLVSIGWYKVYELTGMTSKGI